MNVMRRVSIMGVLVVIVIGIMAVGADLPSRCVLWSADRPLTWADFWAAPPSGGESTSSVHDIISWSSGVSADCGGLTAKAIVTGLVVVNAMDPARSWKAATGLTWALLRHEQLHFDLGEVYRRLVEMTLAPLAMTCQAAAPDASTQDTADACALALQNLVYATGNAILSRASAAQAAYDSETRNGLTPEAQAMWESRVAYLLLYPTAAP